MELSALLLDIRSRFSFSFSLSLSLFLFVEYVYSITYKSFSAQYKQRLKLAIKMLTKGNPVTIKRTTKRKTDVFNIPVTKDDVVKEVRDYLLFWNRAKEWNFET